MGVHKFRDMPRVMTARADEVVRSATRLVRRAASVIDSSVVRGTPVDKGDARSNWVASLDTPFRGVIPAYAPGEKLGLGETENASGALSQASGIIKTFAVSRNKSIFITNNIFYIGQINRKNTQGSTMFVQLAFQAGIASITGERLLKSRTPRLLTGKG